MPARRRPGWPSPFSIALLLLMFCAAIDAQSVEDPAYQPWRSARDRQDLAFLHAASTKAEAAARGNSSPRLLYSAALARSFEAEIALELGKKAEAAGAAESGIAVARRLVEASPKVAEHHRILGTLCGQIIPANLMSAFKYGKCAREEIESALSLDPKSAWAYLGRGVGNYYLPEAFGGGIDIAIRDFRQASALKPTLADSWLWLGIALRKKGDSISAKKAMQKAMELAPERVWTRKQFDKTR